MIGVTLYHSSYQVKKQANITDIIRHIEYICSVGGENNIGFGSDFDGILETVVDVSAYGEIMKM